MMAFTTVKQSRAGFTLIEVVTSLMIMSVLMIGLSGAVVVGAHAIPTSTAVGFADQEVIDVMNQFRSDFREATSVATRSVASKRSLTLEFKSNGAKGSPGVVKYLYNSSTGIFFRQMDSHTEEAVLNNIEAFEISIVKEDGFIRRVNILMTVGGTIQQRYEVHALLPAMPEVK